MLIVATTYDAGRPFPVYLSVNHPKPLRKALKRGEVIAGSPLTQQLKKHVGDEVTLETKLGPKKVRIAAAGNSYAAGGMVLMMEWGSRPPHLQDDGPFLVICSRQRW